MPVRVIDGRSSDDAKRGTDWLGEGAGGDAEDSNGWEGGVGVGVGGCWSM